MANTHTPETHEKQKIFSYVSGQFFFNEELRLQERYMEFDVGALNQATEASISKNHGKVVSIAKIGEGSFSRVFALVLEDDFELIAKIQYHIAMPKYFATVSEAASLT
jgi:hypothetical protein